MRTWFCSSGFGPGPSAGGCGTVQEGLRGPGEEEAEEGGAGEPHRGRVGHVLRVPVAEKCSGRRRCSAQDEAPEEDRALEGRPQAHDRHPVGHRARAHLGHVAHGEVAGQERVDHQQVGRGHDRREGVGQPPRPGPAERAAARPRREAHEGAGGGGEEGEQDEGATESGNHGGLGAVRRSGPVRPPRSAVSSSPWVERMRVLMSTFLSSPGVRYWLSWETISRRLSKWPALRHGALDHHPDAIAEHLRGDALRHHVHDRLPSVTSNSRSEAPPSALHRAHGHLAAQADGGADRLVARRPDVVGPQ